LQAIGLIGLPREVNKRTFYPTGDRFLQLVSFLGCSPHIELDPPADPARLAADSAAGKFCHVYLTRSETLQFRSDPRTPTPRCPHCRAEVPDWQSLIQSWQRNPANGDWHCPHCGATGPITGLSFRKSAGFGRIFLEIIGIYPSEAVPSDALLNTLEALTHGRWSALYLHD
jgi:hypothetical protein